ncbi:MAG: hypothetical protein GY793_09865 [Proteobacteria bacterium]|nr:hypothetical protein [Pseudomonadota bacterium]
MNMKETGRTLLMGELAKNGGYALSQKNRDAIDKHQEEYDEMFEALVDLMTCDALKQHQNVIGDSRYSMLIEEITGKTWTEIKNLIK